MKILLAHNSTYFPAHGGGDKSNRLLMEALAGRGHQVRVFTRTERFGDAEQARYLAELDRRGQAYEIDTEAGEVRFRLGGVDVRVLACRPELRAAFQHHIDDFGPDIIVTSTDDPGQLLFDLAVKAPLARVVYLVRATIAVPFGPDSSSVNERKRELLRRADGVVGVSRYVAGYVRQWAGIPAIHLPISLLEPQAGYPLLGHFDNPYVTMVNPCAVKGISILLGLADRMTHVQFAAVPTWGAEAAELDALRRRPNITLLDPVDNIDDLLKLSRVVLVPSLWAEARSRIVLEAMSRGIPVMASDAGGIHEAMLGVPHLLKVNLIRRYKPAVGSGMVPVAEVPEQDVEPWVEVLDRLTTDHDHWSKIAGQSRRASLEYAATLNVLPFEGFLQSMLGKPKQGPAPEAASRVLSDDRRKLLALMLKKKAVEKKSSRWFAGDLDAPGERLFCFPWAGGGTSTYLGWKQALAGVANVIAIRLPGREDRVSETPLESMEEAVEALAGEFIRHAGAPFSLFGHSMGAVMAFEVARRLRDKGAMGPRLIIASAARAPVFRIGHQPPSDPSPEQFVAELKRLQGIPTEVLEDPRLLELALPALKADARLYRRYVHAPGAPLSIPIAAYRGESDLNIIAEHTMRWAGMTTGRFGHRVFPGGHFYIENCRDALLAAIREDLTRK
ncbi:MAG: alpha/beta fold hydrolase [Bryobacteraceae bacterium]|nr:alpha/beta fold hydrolase [Bryobacteraceae bacterium]